MSKKKERASAETSSLTAEAVLTGNGVFPTKNIPKQKFDEVAHVLKCRAGRATSKKLEESLLFMGICGSHSRFEKVSLQYNVEDVGLAPNELVIAPDGDIVMCIGVTHKSDNPEVWFVLQKSLPGVAFFPNLKKKEDFIKAGFAKISTSAV